MPLFSPARPFLFPVAVMIALAGCARTEPETPTVGSAPGDRREVLAPLEGAELLVRESYPPQYAVRVVSGLPNGCAAFDRVDVNRTGQAFDLTVWNTLPADERVMCTMIYGTTENTVTLGSDLVSGQRYAVRINGDEKIAFTAQ